MTILFGLQLVSLALLSLQDFYRRNVSGYLVAGFWIISLCKIGLQTEALEQPEFLPILLILTVISLLVTVMVIITKIKKKPVIGCVDMCVMIPLLVCLPQHSIPIFLISTGITALCLHYLINKDHIPFMPCLTLGYTVSIQGFF